MTGLRPGVDGLDALDIDQRDRCVICEDSIVPLTGVAYRGGIACRQHFEQEATA